MKKGIIFILVLMFTFSWAFAKESVIIQYDPTNYPDPPQNLMVTNEGYATWETPDGTNPDEFRYDDGVITGRLGFSALPNAVLGASHPNNAIIDEVTWYLTSYAAHTEAIIYIFGLQPDGTPDVTQLLHESALLPNVDDAWNTYTLVTPITAPDGFFIGVCTPNIFTAIGTDDGVGAPWEFQLGTQWGIQDWIAGNVWLDVGTQGFPLNFSIRAYGTDNGPLNLAPRNDTFVNYENSGLRYSELNTPVNTNPGLNRAFLGYNTYLDGVFQVFTTDLFYQYVGLAPGTTYLAEVTAVYDEGESDPIEITFTYSGSEAANVIIATTKLGNNYPNPFNPVTNIAYSIKETGNLTIEVYNMRGQLVKTLIDEVKETGDHTAIWNGTDNFNKSVSSGVYFYKMVSESNIGRYTSTKKMILLK